MLIETALVNKKLLSKHDYANMTRFVITAITTNFVVITIGPDATSKSAVTT